MEVYYPACILNNVARIRTLMSISDGLGPSIFRRKMEGIRRMREEKDGKVFISRLTGHIGFDIDSKKYFPLFVF